MAQRSGYNPYGTSSQYDERDALKQARRMSGSDFDMDDEDFDDDCDEDYDDSYEDEHSCDDDDLGSDLDAYDDLPLEDNSYSSKKDDVLEELGGSLYPPTSTEGPQRPYSAPSGPITPKTSLPSRISDDDILL
jgi:hypothetical protein